MKEKSSFPSYLGCAYGLSSPEFLDVVLLQVCGESAAPCISLPFHTVGSKIRNALHNLDGTAFPIPEKETPLSILIHWANHQSQFLSQNKIETVSLRENLDRATEFLKSAEEKDVPYTEASILAYLVRAMIYSLSGHDYSSYTLQGEYSQRTVQAINDCGITDLTYRALNNLLTSFSGIKSLRVVGPPGVALRGKHAARSLNYFPWINESVITRALDATASLVGPARYLLGDKIARQVNVPWYLKPRQLTTSPSNIHDIKLVQVSYPFWCNWGDTKAYASKMTHLPKYSLWESRSEVLFHTLLKNGINNIDSETKDVLNIIQRWLFGRRNGYSHLRFIDAAREIIKLSGANGLTKVGGLFSIKDQCHKKLSSRKNNNQHSALYINDIALNIMAIEQLSLPRAFCLLTKKEIISISKPIVEEIIAGKELPYLNLRVIER